MTCPADGPAFESLSGQGEREVLYPPLTHLAPGRTQQVKTDGGVTYTVVEVKPSFG